MLPILKLEQEIIQEAEFIKELVKFGNFEERVEEILLGMKTELQQYLGRDDPHVNRVAQRYFNVAEWARKKYRRKKKDEFLDYLPVYVFDITSLLNDKQHNPEEEGKQGKAHRPY